MHTQPDKDPVHRDPVDTVLTADEAAQLLRVSVQTVLKESRDARLPGVKVGREWRYSRLALLHHLTRYTGDPTPTPPPQAHPPVEAAAVEAAVGAEPVAPPAPPRRARRSG